jgi:hypothetical protein
MSEQLPDSGGYEGIDRRLGPRRPVTRRADVSLRTGPLGLGPNLAIGLVDVSEEGMGVKLNGPVKPGEEVEVVVSFPVASKTFKLHGVVCWCNPGPGETFVAGIRLRRRLTHAELIEFS